MRDLSITVTYPLYTIGVTIDEPKGIYSRLDDEAQTRLLDAAVASFPQLQTWLKTIVSGKDQTVKNNDVFTGVAGNGSDTIKVKVTITETKDALPKQLAQAFASSIARSVQNHADAFITGIPASDDMLSSMHKRQALDFHTAYGTDFSGFHIGQHELVTAGSRPTTSRR